ncbi:MAG: hypothetical protein VW270_19335 [Candidatus Poseidoniales archaeon]
MSHPVNEMVKEQIMDEVLSMTVEEFQNALDENKVVGFNPIIDNAISSLVETLFEQRSI